MFSSLLYRNMLYTAITRTKQKCIIIADEIGLQKCKQLMRPRITSLFKKSIDLQPEPELKLFIDTCASDIFISIYDNIDKIIKSPIICKLLTSHSINTNNLNKNICAYDFNSELTYLFTILLKNGKLLDELLLFINKSNNSSHGIMKIIEV